MGTAGRSVTALHGTRTQYLKGLVSKKQLISNRWFAAVFVAKTCPETHSDRPGSSYSAGCTETSPGDLT